MNADLTTVIIFSAIGGVLSLSFALFLLLRKSGANLLASYATPFAAGALLASAFFDLIPEGSEFSSVSAVLNWTLLGFLAFFILESLLGWFHHHHEHIDGRKASTISLIVLGDTIHNFIDGLAIAAAFLIDTSTGIITTLAVSLHEIPQEIGDFGLLLNKGMSRKKIILVNIASALATIVGAIIFFKVGASGGIDTTWLLGITAGFFIYIAASDIIPEIHHSQSRKKIAIQSALVLLGLLTVWGATKLSDELPSADIESQPQVQLIESIDEEVTTKFIVLGDSGNNSTEQKQIAKLIEASDFDAVIHTGDLAYNRGTSTEILENHHANYSEAIREKLWPSIGNHDNATKNAQPYLNYFDLPKQALNEKDNERYYSVDIGQAHIVSIDSNTALEEISDSRKDDMADWLRQDLADVNPQMAVIVFMHHPPFNTGKHEPNLLVREHLIPIFDEFGVDLVLGGHDHNYQRTCLLLFSVNGTACQPSVGIPYVVTGGGGRGIYDIKTQKPHFEVAISQHNFVKLEVDTSGKIKLQAINIDNQIIDNVEITNRD